MDWNSRFSRLNRVFSRLTLYLEIFQIQETFCFQVQSTEQKIQSTESCLETFGFQVQSAEQTFQSTESCLGCFSAYSNEEKPLPKCNRTNIGSKGLCQSATRPYMLLDASPKARSNIHKRIFTQIWLKNPKIGIFTKPIQTKSQCTRISVRNSYLTFEDNYKHRCEIKISPLN